MCERGWRAWNLIVAVGALLLPRVGAAQTAAAPPSASPRAAAPEQRAGLALARASFERRRAALADTSARLEARLVVLEAEARIVARDTVRDGAFVLVTTPTYLPAARAALAVAAPAVRARWGEQTVARAFDATVVRIMTVPSSRLNRATSRTYATVLRRDLAEREGRLEPVEGDTAAAIAKFLTEATGEVIQDHLDGRLSNWIGRARITDSASGFERAFVDMVTAPALVARQCATGDDARCIEALQLTPPSGDPRATWYSPDDQRVVARAWWAGRRRPTSANRVENPCASAPMTADCRAFADSLSANTWTYPLAADARGTLLAVATELGGDAGWARLLEDPSSPLGQRIEAAAARPLAQVVRVWRERVLRARPDPVRPRTSALASAVLLALTIVVIVAVRRERA